MRILAIETATIEVGVALADETGPVAVVTSRPGRRQVETLHPAISDACRIARLTLADLDAVAVDIGPGLFTGLRVGVAAAKALGGALGIPVVTATSLEILLAACPPRIAVVIPVIDMRRGEVAWLPTDGPTVAPRVGTPEQLAAELAGLAARTAGGRPLLLVGDGALRYRLELAGDLEPGPVFGGTELAAPPVASLAMVAMSAMKNGRCSDPAGVRPLYGREADARINWSSREGRAALAQ
ncbi:MAG TPA: tRNA (adenosine(37)-N6)-threonylcarbamoyltransferase complex dimerization subunit type 1 TsaB [Acidimicrobiales bacterium]|nr:tRNA (adenosine(37)-N6)-threonylcarbamoyltransferase complex dimerization subunit type 1 TsaB [Acidimicrobiales bacterium]